MEMAFSICRCIGLGQFGFSHFKKGRRAQGPKQWGRGGGSDDLQRNLVMPYLALHTDGSSLKESRPWRYLCVVCVYSSKAAMTCKWCCLGGLDEHAALYRL